MVPVDNPKIFLTSGGGDAVDATAKLIRRYWSAIGRPEKSLLVTRSSSYHGLHGHGTSIVGIEIHKEGLPHLDPGTLRIPTNDAAALEQLIAERGDEIAAVFCEPVVGSGGIIPPAPGYLQRVQELCRANDIIFVADEVITGLRPRRRHVRQRALRPAPRRDDHGQGHDLGLPADGRHASSASGSGSRSGRTAATSCSATG